jgi:1-acyl-sn-glycerol-3-phosphate acyltransferase
MSALVKLDINEGNWQSEARTDYRKASPVFVILRGLVRLLLNTLFRIEVRGLENLPREGGYIFAGNHLSWLDPFLMLTMAPASPRIHFLGAKENMETSKFRKYLTEEVGGVIPVRRGTANAYREIAGQIDKVLSGGGVLGIFPEGTVSETETGKLLPFKKGIGYFAAHSGMPIVPVAFSGTKEPWLGKRIVMVIGKPVSGQQGGREVAEQLTAQTVAAIQELLPAPQAVDPNSPKLLKNFFTNLFIDSKNK